jgi:hypothetical protein
MNTDKTNAAANGSATDLGDSLGNTTRIVLVTFKFIFMAVLGVGWFRLLLPTVGDWLTSLSWVSIISAILAGGLAFFAPFLARMIGALRSVAGLQKASFSWVVYFIPLFAISALGTLNTMFYFGESRIILLETVDQAHDALEKLASRSKTVLVTPAFTAKQDQAYGLLQSVFDEINNPNNCGEGPVARANMAQLQKLLPDFKALSAGARDCSKSAEISKLYKNQVDKLLAATSEYQTEKVAQTRVLSEKINNTVTQQQALLQKAKSGLDISALTGGTSNAADRRSASTAGEKTTAAPNDNKSLGGRAAIEASIESAATAMRSLKADLSAFKGPTSVADLPDTKELQTIRGLGSLSQVIPSLLARLDRASTYYYILAAVLMDLILIAFYTRAFNEQAQRRIQKQQTDERLKVEAEQQRAQAKRNLANQEQALIESNAKLRQEKEMLEAQSRGESPTEEGEDSPEGLDDEGLPLLPSDERSDYEDQVKAWLSNMSHSEADKVGEYLRQGKYNEPAQF